MIFYINAIYQQTPNINLTTSRHEPKPTCSLSPVPFQSIRLFPFLICERNAPVVRPARRSLIFEDYHCCLLWSIHYQTKYSEAKLTIQWNLEIRIQ